MKKFKHSGSRSLALAGTAFCALLAIGVGGCASNDDKPGLAPVPEGLEPRPQLSSIPADSVRVAVFQGGADISYDLVEGQRYFLVDETTDTRLTSGLADRDGEIEIGKNGARFRGREVWGGDVDAANQVGLYVSRELETP